MRKLEFVGLAISCLNLETQVTVAVAAASPDSINGANGTAVEVEDTNKDLDVGVGVGTMEAVAYLAEGEVLAVDHEVDTTIDKV